jgi:hypothetical protein
MPMKTNEVAHFDILSFVYFLSATFEIVFEFNSICEQKFSYG